MDQHPRRYITRSEQFTLGGRNHNPENTSLAQTRGDPRGEVQLHSPSENSAMSDQYISSGGRNHDPENTSLSRTSGNPRGGVQFHNHSGRISSLIENTTQARTRGMYPHVPNPRSWSNDGIDQHQHRNYVMPEEFSSLSGNFATAVGSFPFKRKHGDVSMAFNIRNSNWSPFEASSSSSGLLDRQRMSEITMNSQQYSRSNHPFDISERNVRSRSGPYSAPTPGRNHPNFVPQNFNTPIETNRLRNDANQFMYERRGVDAGQYSHGVISGTGTNSVSRGADQLLSTRHGVDAGQYSFGSIPGRWCTDYQSIRATGAIESNASRANQLLSARHGMDADQYNFGAIPGRSAIPSLQYPEAIRLRIPSTSLAPHPRDEYEGRWPTEHQSIGATGAIESYASHATMHRNDGTPLNGYHAASGYVSTSIDYSAQFPTEVHSSRYSMSSIGMEHTNYQSDQARNTNEHFPSPAAAMNRNDSTEIQPNLTEDEYVFYRAMSLSPLLRSSNPIPSSRERRDEFEAMLLDIDSMSYEDLLALGEDIGNVETGLSSDKVSKCLVELPVCASEPNTEKKLCSICLDDLLSMDKAMKLRSCGHEYHVHCITKWLGLKNACPLCKRSATSGS